MPKMNRGNAPVEFWHRSPKPIGEDHVGLSCLAGFYIYALRVTRSKSGLEFINVKLVAAEPQAGRAANFWLSFRVSGGLVRDSNFGRMVRSLGIDGTATAETVAGHLERWCWHLLEAVKDGKVPPPPVADSKTERERRPKPPVGLEALL